MPMPRPNPVYLTNRVKRIQRFWRASCVPVEVLIQRFKRFNITSGTLRTTR